jgi:ATP-dependent Zn protease
MMKFERMALARKQRLLAGVRLHNLDEDCAVAQHEAGHTLVARLLNFTVDRVTIDPNVGSAGMTSFDDADGDVFEKIIVRMAGSEAERLLGGSDDGCKSDLREARALAETISDDVADIVRQARRRARSLLRRHFVPLTKLAIALLERRSLDADEIADILDERGGDDEDDDDGDDPQKMFERIVFNRRHVFFGAAEPMHHRALDDDDDFDFTRELVKYRDDDDEFSGR